MKVVVTTNRFAPNLSEGAVGIVTDFNKEQSTVSFSGNRLYVLKSNEMRIATQAEIKAHAADSDQDELHQS